MPVDEALIARIVARVLGMLNGHQDGTSARRVLTLFSGASAGQKIGLEGIQWLAGAGHDVTAVISFAAGSMMPQGELAFRAAAPA